MDEEAQSEAQAVVAGMMPGLLGQIYGSDPFAMLMDGIETRTDLRNEELWEQKWLPAIRAIVHEEIQALKEC